mgnify:CR=1 FL=1
MVAGSAALNQSIDRRRSRRAGEQQVNPPVPEAPSGPEVLETDHQAHCRHDDVCRAQGRHDRLTAGTMGLP